MNYIFIKFKKLMCLILILLLSISIMFSNQVVIKADDIASSDVELIVDSFVITSPDIKEVQGVLYVKLTKILPLITKVSSFEQKEDILVASGSFGSMQVYAMKVINGKKYVNINGRYLYIKNKVIDIEGDIALPVDIIAKMTGGYLNKDIYSNNYRLHVGNKGLLYGSAYYTDSTVELMAKTIYSEAGNQSLEGKIAVGNVILNRQSSSIFPNTVSEVVFAPNQFDGVRSSNFYKVPSEECYIAAKIALERVQLVDGALYFNRAGMNSWASRAKTYICTIDSHDFYK